MKYKRDAIAPSFIKDEFVTRSRHHAFNCGISALITILVIAIALNYGVWRLFNKYFIGESFIGILCFALFQYGNALKIYTEQDREIILSKYFAEESLPVEVEAPQLDSKNDRTELPHPSHKNGRLILGIGLTELQKEKIARAGLQKNSLPINLLESFGLSRQKAEALRLDLSSMSLGYFTDKDRFVLTNDGQKVFAKIIRKS